MVHQIDLGTDRIAAPDHDEFAVRNFPGINTALGAGTCVPAGISQRCTERRVLAGILHHVAQTFDIVTLHQAHRTGVKIRPHGLCPVALRDRYQFVRYVVQGFVPADRLKSGQAGPFVPGAPERLRQPIRVVHPFRVAGDFGTDRASRIGVIPGAVYPSNGVLINALNL